MRFAPGTSVSTQLSQGKQCQNDANTTVFYSISFVVLLKMVYKIYLNTQQLNYEVLDYFPF